MSYQIAIGRTNPDTLESRLAKRDHRAVGREPYASAWPSAASAWWAVSVFCLAGVLSYTDRLILSLLVDGIRKDLHVSDTQISLLQGTAFALIFAFAGFPLGRLTDLWSRRGLLIFGVAIWTAGTVLCGLAKAFSGLFLARALVGIGEAVLAPAVLSLISDLFPPHRRGVAVAAYMTSLCIGAGVAMSVGGEMLQAARAGLLGWLPVFTSDSPWRSVLLALGIPGALTCFLLLTVREPDRRGEQLARANQNDIVAALSELLRHRRTIAPLIGAMAVMSAGDFALLNWVPSLLSRFYHLEPSDIGARLGAVAVLSGVSGSILAGFVGDRLVKQGGAHRRGFVAAAGALLATATALIALDWGADLAIACFGIWMFLSWGGQTLGAGTLQDAVPNQLRGLGTASMAFCNMAFGLSIGTTATALLSDHLFHSPLALGKSLAILVAPCAAIAALLYFRAANVLRGPSTHNLKGVTS